MLVEEGLVEYIDAEEVSPSCVVQRGGHCMFRRRRVWWQCSWMIYAMHRGGRARLAAIAIRRCLGDGCPLGRT